MSGKKVMKLATRGKRFGAAVIDMVPSMILSTVVIVQSIYRMVQALSGSFWYNGYNYSPFYYRSYNSFTIWNALMLILIGVQIYFYCKGQSIGKAILGLRVVNDRTGQPLGAGYMLLREFLVKPAGGSVFLLGYIWVLIDKYNRGWHDKILDTYVVDERASAIQSAVYSGAADVSTAVSKATADVKETVKAETPANVDTEVADEPVNDVSVIDGYDPDRYTVKVTKANSEYIHNEADKDDIISE